MPTAEPHNIPVLWREPDFHSNRRLVIWLPGFTGSKEAVANNLDDLAQAGYVALSLDPVDHGPRARNPGPEPLNGAGDEFVAYNDGRLYRHFWSILAQTIREVSVIIDWAEAELGIAPPVGLGGISMGGDIALAAAGTDPRISVVAAAIATGDWAKPTSIYKLSAPNEHIQRQFERYNPLVNVERYRHLPAVAIFCGSEDEVVPPEGAVRFVQALGPIYEAAPERIAITIEARIAHEFTNSMWQGCLDWFRRHLEPA